MQKENLFFFSFPSASKFGKAKVTQSRAQNKKKSFVFLPRQSKFAIFDGVFSHCFNSYLALKLASYFLLAFFISAKLLNY